MKHPENPTAPDLPDDLPKSRLTARILLALSKEIAEMRGTSTSTIQGRYRYGLEKLRTIVDGEMIR